MLQPSEMKHFEIVISDWRSRWLVEIWQPVGEGSTWVHHPRQLLRPNASHCTGCTMGRHAGKPCTARILCRSFMLKRHRQLWVKNLPKIPMWQLERD